MPPHDKVAGLVARLEAGDLQAAEEFYTSYAERLARLAQRHLRKPAAGPVDGEDVVQSVFRTFFRRDEEGRLRYQIASADKLWRLLMKITILKAKAALRRELAVKRGAGRQPTTDEAQLAEILAHDPQPVEVAIYEEQIELLTRDLDADYREILELRLKGYRTREIADKQGSCRRTIDRRLQFLRDRLGGSIARWLATNRDPVPADERTPAFRP